MSKPSSSLGLIGIIILMTGQFLPSIDFSIVNVALDVIGESLHATHIQLELMVAVYGVGFAVCLAMGSRLGDNFGRRRLFMVGAAVFGLASLACGLATSIEMLLFARAIQGIGAALIAPQVLATLHVSLTGKQHSMAISVYAAVGGLAFVTGQIFGGWLVTANFAGMGWRALFLINIPVCLIILLFAKKWIPETKSDHAATIDWFGTLLLAAAVVCLLIPISLGPQFNWSWPFVLMLVCVLPLFYLFWKVEVREEQQHRFPLMPPRLLALPSMQFGLILAVLFFSCWSGYMFSVALTLQSGLGFSPVQSGNVFIGMGVVFFSGSLLSARISAYFGRFTTLMLGCFITMAGVFGLILSFRYYWPDISALALLPSIAVLGFGQSLLIGSFFRIGLSDVPSKDAGAGSAMLTTVQQAAFGLGSALLGGILYQVFHFTHNWLSAVTGALTGELVLLFLLLVFALIYRRHIKQV